MGDIIAGMQPPFTECAREIIRQAQSEARDLNQEFVGTEHLALSLMAVPACEAMRVVHAQHVNQNLARSWLLSILPKSAQAPVISGDLPLSPRLQRAVNSAIVAAQAARREHVSTRELMLALLDPDDSPLVSALRQAGADIDVLRQALAVDSTERET